MSIVTPTPYLPVLETTLKLLETDKIRGRKFKYITLVLRLETKTGKQVDPILISLLQAPEVVTIFKPKAMEFSHGAHV